MPSRLRSKDERRRAKVPQCWRCRDNHPEGTSCTIPDAPAYAVGNVPDGNGPPNVTVGRYVVPLPEPVEDRKAYAIAGLERMNAKRIRIVEGGGLSRGTGRHGINMLVRLSMLPNRGEEA